MNCLPFHFGFKLFHFEELLSKRQWCSISAEIKMTVTDTCLAVSLLISAGGRVHHNQGSFMTGRLAVELFEYRV